MSPFAWRLEKKLPDLVIIHKNDPLAAALADQTVAKLKGEYRIFREISDFDGVRQKAPADFQPVLVISIGGDGTLLYSSRAWGLGGTPILGVNLGSVGFLAEVDPVWFNEILEKALNGQAEIETRQALDIEVARDDERLATFTVYNDAVINKGALSRIMNLKLSIAGSTFWNFRADGLILATPTGSTAYNLSAGGPVVYHSLEVVIVTPICPFTLSSRALILPLDLELYVSIDKNATDTHLTGDGQVYLPLQPGDLIKVGRSNSSLRLINNPHRQYFDALRVKLGFFNDERR
ncbi:MAG: NAD(+)/NADH kinase [Deltaproteobacteria bacterium]|nr:NAD(+)/NADH kinase [Deltaproteobacteria bacterium]